MLSAQDFKNWSATRVAVFSDPTVSKLRPLKRAIESLEASGVPFDVYTECRVEPNQESWTKAIDWTKRIKPSHFLAVGGGSVIDTAKVANLYLNHPENELLDFVNAPVGKGLPINKACRASICAADRRRCSAASSRSRRRPARDQRQVRSA